MMTYDEFKRIRVKHIPALYVRKHRYVSYKNISINLIFEEITIGGDWLKFGVL